MDQNIQKKTKKEIGTFIFAIINLIITGIAFGMGVGYLLFILISSLVDPNSFDISNSMWAFVFGIQVLAIVGAGIAFAFGVTLMIGIAKKRAILLKVYFVYGIIVVVASFIASLYFVADMAESLSDFLTAEACFLGCGLYILILFMVYKTYSELDDTTHNDAVVHQEKLIDNKQYYNRV